MKQIDTTNLDITTHREEILNLINRLESFFYEFQRLLENIRSYEHKSRVNNVEPKLKELLKKRYLTKTEYDYFFIYELDEKGKVFLYNKLLDNLLFELRYKLGFRLKSAFEDGQNSIWPFIKDTNDYIYQLLEEHYGNKE